MFGKLSYPKTRAVAIQDDFFGTNVPDPYRWLEDASDADVQAWTQEQMDFALEILGTMPGREKFKKRLTEVWNYPKYTTPVKKGNRLFYTYNDGLKNQPVLYVKEGDAEPRILINPNTWADGGIYNGEWKEDTRNGKGEMRLANGDNYKGYYKDDM